MIQIAICDDDMTTTSQIEEYIRQIETKQHIQVQSRIFFDGKSFMQSVESGEVYDLIYLDVEMPLMKGLDVAKKLREMEISSLIIYISNYETYCESMIETEPFRFLRKPINDVDLFRKYFMSAYKKLENRNEYYTYSYKKIHHKININDIMYFESNNRKICIHTNGNQENNTFYGQLDKVEKELESKSCTFIRIHQSYLVNSTYINTVQHDAVILENKDELSISEKRQKEIQRKLFLER